MYRTTSAHGADRSDQSGGLSRYGRRDGGNRRSRRLRPAPPDRGGDREGDQQDRDDCEHFDNALSQILAGPAERVRQLQSS